MTEAGKNIDTHTATIVNEIESHFLRFDFNRKDVAFLVKRGMSTALTEARQETWERAISLAMEVDTYAVNVKHDIVVKLLAALEAARDGGGKS